MRDDGQSPETTGAGGSSQSGDARHDRALILVEIADFAGLRRQLGMGRARTLALHVAEHAAALLPDASVATIGRDLIEVGLPHADAAALDAAVAGLHRFNDQPFTLDGQQLTIGVWVGAALGGQDAVALAEAAEAALAEARTSVRCDRTAAVVRPLAPQDAAVGKALRLAIDRDELFLQYQPKLHLRRQAITSLEALIRWRHPERGLVLPNDFIPAAERSGAIKPMTLWTLQQVIADQRVLARNGRDLPIFVNIAGVLLSDVEFVEAACTLVSHSGAKLGFEITETSVIREPESAVRHLQQFADIGVSITIDDYGAGLSSLAYLKQLPARELKIDKLFVTELSSSHRDPLIVRSTIDLAHALEMEVVAEGVETATSLALLTVMGCDLVQGFLISRPLGFEALLVYLREESHRALMEQSRSPLQRLAAVRARG